MTELMSKKYKIDIPDWYVKSFDLIQKNTNGAMPDILKVYRTSSFQKLLEIGFPTTKVEDWKYTNVYPIIEKKYKASNFINIFENGELINNVKNLIESNPVISFLSSFQLVFIDGNYIDSLSSVQKNERFILQPISQALKSENGTVLNHLNKYSIIENGFNALNNIFFIDGFYLEVKDNVIEDEPFVAIFVQSGIEPLMINSRNLIVVGKHSKVKVIEIFISLNDEVSFTNSITEAVLGENSFVEHYKYQAESEKSYHIGKIQSEILRNANFTSHNLVFGAAITRNDINNVLNGEGSEVHMYGLYFTQNAQHVDSHTLVDHAKPHCLSNELYKGILADNSRGVFNGKIIVRKGAQKTNAYQSNKNLLLSGHAKIDTKPQLEIFADDVRCTHGATVGQVEDDSLFYLRVRGIEEKTARTLLVNAFANDVLMNMTFEPFREKISEVVSTRMNLIQTRSAN